MQVEKQALRSEIDCTGLMTAFDPLRSLGVLVLLACGKVALPTHSMVAHLHPDCSCLGDYGRPRSGRFSTDIHFGARGDVPLLPQMS